MKAAKNPVELEYDERKYRRKTKTYDSKIGAVTVPEEHDEDIKKYPARKGGDYPRGDSMAAPQARLRSGPGCLGCEKRPEPNA